MQPKANHLNVEYFPSLVQASNDVCLSLNSAEVDVLNPIQVRLRYAKTLAFMGDLVHFLFDKENLKLYIKGDEANQDTQAPLWSAKYSDASIHYSYSSASQEQSSLINNLLIAQIETLVGIDEGKITGSYELKGKYSFEDKALIFDLNSLEINGVE